MKKKLHTPALFQSLTLVLIVVVSPPISAQQISSTDSVDSDLLSSDPVYRAWGANSEVRQCGLCHFSPGNAFASRDTDFCDLTEAKTWLENDSHAISRQRIEPLDRADIERYRRGDTSTGFGESNHVSLRMCQSLGYDVQTEIGYAQFRDNCLTCHAGYEPHSSTADFTRATPNRPGISCNYCHQSGENVEWIDRHSSSTPGRPWRLLPPHEKAAAGMRDLFGARAQGELCSSCHIGDHERNMFVTHEMYVAGHPPLPNFELQKFVSSMPAHWRDIEQTHQSLAAFGGRDAYILQNIDQDQPEHLSIEDTFWETRTLLLGALAAAQQSVALTAEANDHWGDYALYDCSACHHELRIPSQRQNRRIDEVPGRPRLLEWPAPLLSVALSITNSADEVRTARNELSKAVNAIPFGEPSICKPAAARLQTALQQASERLEKAPIQARHVRQVLLGLTLTPPELLVDYHSSRQVIWGIEVIDFELASKGQSLGNTSRKLIRELGQREQQTLVSKAFPSGRSGTLFEVPSENSGSAQVSYLAAELERMRLYEPEIIQSQLKELRLTLE